VMSSGAIIPARAPASIDILLYKIQCNSSFNHRLNRGLRDWEKGSLRNYHMLIRASIESASIAVPVNSMTEPVPPAVPIRPMICNMRSLDVIKGASKTLN
jgi:hypothetical protein